MRNPNNKSEQDLDSALSKRASQMKYIWMVGLAVALMGCGDFECVTAGAPEMVGDWVHYSANEGFHFIYIKENGRGNMWGENDHGNTQDTSGRGWYISNDILYFSRWQNTVGQEQFAIDQYPEIASADIELPFDTIPSGISYMILDGRTYKQVE